MGLVSKKGTENYINNLLTIFYRPNVWPHMMHLIIFGLENLQDERTSNLALKWANRWVRSNWIAYNEHDGMFEKYIATEFGGVGGGESLKELIFIIF